jgi:hypothetical protein
VKIITNFRIKVNELSKTSFLSTGSCTVTQWLSKEYHDATCLPYCNLETVIV